jgi:hypothetical protein
MKLCRIFPTWISNYTDKVTDIIKAKLLGDFYLVNKQEGRPGEDLKTINDNQHKTTS